MLVTSVICWTSLKSLIGYVIGYSGIGESILIIIGGTSVSETTVEVDRDKHAEIKRSY